MRPRRPFDKGRLGDADSRILDGRRLTQIVTDWVGGEPYLLGEPAQ